MTAGPLPPARRGRIIVALDEDTPRTAAVIAAAASLAKEMSAELTGVFVEDIDHLQAAAHPGRIAISPGGLHTLGLSPAAMSHQMKARADVLRVRIEKAARGLGLPWTFVIRRGAVADELVSMSAECDILALGASSRLARRIHLGATARALIDRAKSTLLVVSGGGRAASVVAITANGGAAGDLGALAARATGLVLTRYGPEACPALLASLRRGAPGLVVTDRACLAKLRLTLVDLAMEVEPYGILVTPDR